MKDFIRKRLMVLGNSTSQWINANILFGLEDESISGRCYRRAREGSAAWNRARKVVDWLLSWLEPEHCRRSYFTDIEIITARHSDHVVLMQTTREPEGENTQGESGG